MITRQRLGQLIKEEKFIYTTRMGGKKPEKFKLYKDFYMSQKDTLCCLNKSHEFLVCEVKFKYLFETKEDAEWELEMTATRTETLKFPNYEDVFKQDRCLDCYTKEFAITKTDTVVGICLFGVDFTNKMVEVGVGADKMFIGELTKENYIKACRLAKKLFLGENDDK